jgi:energy-coupling factor transport system permease protein
MRSLTLGRFVPYGSFIHKLDPRAKLLGMILIMTLIFLRFDDVLTNFFFYGWIFLFVSLCLRIARIKFSQLFKQLRALWVMMVFLLIINILIPNTTTISGYIDVFGIYIYWGSIVQTAYIVFRLMLMIALTLILTTTTRPLDLTYAIEWYLIPLKPLRFPTHEVAMTIAIALRFIPTLLEETMRIMKAQASRGVDFIHGKFQEKIRAVVSLIVPLFISSFQRSEELANAMEARGYQPSARRTRYRMLTWKSRDTLAIFLVVTLFVTIMTFNILQFNIQGWFM